MLWFWIVGQGGIWRCCCCCCKSKTLSERGFHFERDGRWSQSWCEDIRWWVGLKGRIVWHGSIRSHAQCEDIRWRVYLEARIVWRGGEVITIWIAFCKMDVLIGLKTIDLVIIFI